MADGYGPYNQPRLPDGTYSGPRVYTPYDGPRGDAPPATVYTPEGGDPRGYDRGAPPPPPPSSYYQHSDAPPPPAYAPRDETRVYEPKPDRSYRDERPYNGDERSAYGRAQEDDAPASRRPWSGRTDGEMVAVAPGDTLYTLARRYGVTVDMIARANGLSTVYVRPGTKLFIPRADPASYAQAPARGPAKADQTAAAPAAKESVAASACLGGQAEPRRSPRRPGPQSARGRFNPAGGQGRTADLAERAYSRPAGS